VEVAEARNETSLEAVLTVKLFVVEAELLNLTSGLPEPELKTVRL